MKSNLLLELQEETSKRQTLEQQLQQLKQQYQEELAHRDLKIQEL
jgi:hypothetical protein